MKVKDCIRCIDEKFIQLSKEQFTGRTIITIEWNQGGVRDSEVEIQVRQRLVKKTDSQ